MTNLQFGVIGLGNFGKNYLRLLEKIPGVKIIATSNNLKKSLKILSDPRINCVVIATPPSTHFDLAKKALLSGKHVLLEKPAVLNTKDAKKLGGEVKRSKTVFMVAHQYLYNDYIVFLKKKLDKKFLGKLHYIYGEHFYLGGFRKDVGFFADAIPHEFSILEYLFGPLSISQTSGSKQSFQKGHLHDDFVTAQIKFNNVPLFGFAGARFAPQKVHRLFFAGEKGFAVFDDIEPKNKLKFFPCPYPGDEEFGTKSSLFLNIKKDKIKIPRVFAKEPLLNELNHFISCVRNNKTPLTDIDHVIRVANIIERCGKNLI